MLMGLGPELIRGFSLEPELRERLVCYGPPVGGTHYVKSPTETKNTSKTRSWNMIRTPLGGKKHVRFVNRAPGLEP